MTRAAIQWRLPESDRGLAANFDAGCRSDAAIETCRRDETEMSHINAISRIEAPSVLFDVGGSERMARIRQRMRPGFGANDDSIMRGR